MANKNKLIRLEVLDKCFRNKYRKYKLEDLIEACSKALDEYEGIKKGISKRSIQADIKDMRSGKFGYEAPIVCEESYYFYTDRDFSIHKSPILEEDVIAIKNTLDILSQFSEFEQTQEMQKLIEKLSDIITLYDEDDRTLIQFEKNTYPAAEQWIKILYKHLKLKEGIILHYQPFKYDTPKPLKVVPLLLKEYNGRWFLIGHNQENQHTQNFALDRIKNIEIDEDYTEYTINFDPNKYFTDIIGVSRSEEDCQIIQIQTNDTLKNYLKTKPLHQSQKLIDNDKNIFQFRLGINYEFRSKLLSFGAQLKILQPQSLIEQMKKIHQKALEQYL